jgi:hypothetical protein
MAETASLPEGSAESPPAGRAAGANAYPIQRMIDQACVVGAHGLTSVVVETYRPPEKGWRSTKASAVAFVYVDPSGRVLLSRKPYSTCGDEDTVETGPTTTYGRFGGPLNTISR